MKLKTEPVRTDDGSWNPELAGHRPPWFGQELPGVTRSSRGAAIGIVVRAILGPYGVAIAIGALGLEEPAVMIELAGLVDGGLLDQRQAPLHLVAVGARRPAGQRERPRDLGRAGGKVLPVGVLVRLLAPRAGAAAGLDGVGEAVDADPEVALAGEDVVAAGVAHGPGVAAFDHARAGSLGAAAAAPGRRAGCVGLVHDVRAGDAVEAAGEERAGDVALLGPGRAAAAAAAAIAVVVVHGLVVGRHGDVDVVVLEVDAADLRVEIVARVADEAARVGPAAEDDRGRRRGRGGRLAGAALWRHAAGAAVLEDPLGRHAASVGARLVALLPAGLCFQTSKWLRSVCCYGDLRNPVYLPKQRMETFGVSEAVARRNRHAIKSNDAIDKEKVSGEECGYGAKSKWYADCCEMMKRMNAAADQVEMATRTADISGLYF